MSDNPAPRDVGVMRVYTDHGEASLIIADGVVDHASPSLCWALGLSLPILISRITCHEYVANWVLPDGGRFSEQRDQPKKTNPVTIAEAKALKLTQYNTGWPCRNGHKANRYIATGTCVECGRLKRQRRMK